MSQKQLVINQTPFFYNYSATHQTPYILFHKSAKIFLIALLLMANSFSFLSANPMISTELDHSISACDPADPNEDCDGDGTLNGEDENPLDPCIDWTIQLASNDCDGDGVTVGQGDPDDLDFCTPTPQPECEQTQAVEEEEEYEEIEFDEFEEEEFEMESGSTDHIVMANPCPDKENSNPIDCDGDGTINNEDQDPLDPCVGWTNILGTNDCDGDGITVKDGDPNDFDYCTPIEQPECKDASSINTSAGVILNEPCPTGVDCFVLVESKALLQGAYDEDDPTRMYDKLRQKELIPLTEPYSNLMIFEGERRPFATIGSGGEKTTSSVLAKTGNDAIVDWVFVELHHATEPTKIVATRSALIQRDGDIVDIDGSSPLRFDIQPDKYYLAVRHRNHLGVMTRKPIAFSMKSKEKVDFTSMATETYQLDDSRKGSSHAQRRIDDLHYLWGGNANGDRATIYQGPGLDQTKVFYDIFIHPDNIGPDGFPNYNFILRDYSISDSNMDGEVRYQGPENDVDDLQFFNVILHPENPVFFNNKIIYEQIPVTSNKN